MPGLTIHRRLVLAALAAGAATAHAQPRSEGRLRVVASFSILADMVREVAGDAAEVVALVGANADAHLFQPTPADARALVAAELVFVNGLGFEGWVDRLVRASGYRGPVVVATAGIVPLRVGQAVDPHAWQDLGHARTYVANIRAALERARPAQAAMFRQRAEDYLVRIGRLEQHLRQALKGIPRDQRRVITSHDAFGYLAAAYGISFLAPRGWTTEAEPSAAGVAAIVRQIRRDQVRALLVENISERRLMEQIARETGAVVGGTLYSDALSPPGTAADTYLRLVEHNLRTIVAALRAAASR